MNCIRLLSLMNCIRLFPIHKKQLRLLKPMVTFNLKRDDGLADDDIPDTAHPKLFESLSNVLSTSPKAMTQTEESDKNNTETDICAIQAQGSDNVMHSLRFKPLVEEKNQVKQCKSEK